MKIKLEWKEGREIRRTETELPNKPWLELIEYIRQLLKKAYKYNDEPIPTGLLGENESL